MRELSLFTGAGGGLLGTHLLGWKAIGYVEFNEYCQRVIRQRIDDGILPVAPIFGDIRAFISEGYAAAYSGLVDVISGGFPCQPFSVAGRKLAADDPRNMWPATLESVRIIRPRHAFLENVPGLVATGYFDTVIGDLAENGYSCRWRVLSAAELGAPHRRERLWIVATDTHGTEHQAREREATPLENALWYDTGGLRDILPNAASAGLQNGRSTQVGESRPQPQSQRPTWWKTEPDVGRVVDGMAARVDRLKAAGNGQVPAVAAAAWHLLTEDLYQC